MSYEEDDDDDDDDDSDSDSDDDDRGFAPPIAGPRPVSIDASSALSVTNSSFSAAHQSLKDDTLFGSKIGANPFSHAPQTGAAAGSNSGGHSTAHSNTGSGPQTHAGAEYQVLGNVGDMGTVYQGRPLLDSDKTNTWSAESPSKGGR